MSQCFFPELTVNGPGGYSELSDSVIIHHTAFLLLLCVLFMSKTLKKTQKNIMISDHTPFIIEKQFKVCAQYVFMFVVASGQSQAGCLQLSSVGRLLASSFTFDTQT